MNQEYKRALHIFQLKKGVALEEVTNYTQKYKVNLSIEYKRYSFEKKQTEHDLIFSTAKGVFILDTKKKKAIQILKGKYYGITRWNDWWLFAKSNNKGERDQYTNERISDICIAKIEDNQIVKLQPLIYGIPGEVHQIDIYHNKLYIPHTDFNQIIIFDLIKVQRTNLCTLEAAKSIYLNITSPSHINSIFIKDKLAHIIAHNFTMYSKKFSDLILLNLQDEIIKNIIPLQAHSAHNILQLKDKIIFCDSNHYQLLVDNQAVFKADKLLRGLSITDSHIFVGGSDVTFDHYQRFSNNSCIYILDRNTYKLQEKIDLPDFGDIYEIRQYHQTDFALSNQNANAK